MVHPIPYGYLIVWGDRVQVKINLNKPLQFIVWPPPAPLNTCIRWQLYAWRLLCRPIVHDGQLVRNFVPMQTLKLGRAVHPNNEAALGECLLGEQAKAALTSDWGFVDKKALQWVDYNAGGNARCCQPHRAS